MKDVLEKYMFWVILMYTIIIIPFSMMSVGTWEMNRTVEWEWDITNLIWWNSSDLYIFLLIGYGTVLITKRTTNYYISGVHLLILIANFLLELTFEYILVNMVLYYINWIVFLLNLTHSEKRMRSKL